MVTIGHHGEALHHGGEHIFFAHQAAIEKRQPGAGHHQHQGGADQHPGVVGGALRLGDLLFEFRDALRLRVRGVAAAAAKAWKFEPSPNLPGPRRGTSQAGP